LGLQGVEPDGDRVAITVIQLDIVAAAADDSPAATFVRFGLWDDAFDPATGNLRNNAAEAQNFVGSDSRHFFFRLRDASRAGTATIRWRTLFANNTLDDPRTPAGNQDLTVSGGVSVGEEDHVKAAVEHLGCLDLWRVAIRPGKPLAYGHLGPRRTPFIGVPGNPVSLFVTFCLFAHPFIRRRQGVAGGLEPRSYLIPADFAWTKAAEREEFPRARLVPGRDDQPRVQLYPSHSSAVLSSLTWAEGLAVITAGRMIRPGEPVPFIPLTELLS